jgi:SRSO17 transposase
VLVVDEGVAAASYAVVDDRLQRWRSGFEDMFALVAGRFAQAGSRWRARMYLLGLLSDAERKNSWSIAEAAGERTPDGMQRLLNFYSWDAEAVRDDLRGYVLDWLTEPSGVLVADETGFVKKGTKSAGVQRQYSGTAGKIENCQLGVFVTYASARGRALIDRELYLPASWCTDRVRCTEAGIGDDVQFATTPELVRRMLAALWPPGCSSVGSPPTKPTPDNPALRSWLQQQDINYVLALSCDQRFATPTGRRRADELARIAPKRAWQRLSAGQGSKGHRLYDWLLLDPGADDHQLLVRRSISTPGELAYYIIHTTAPVPLAELVRVAGARWAVEETFQFAKNETGLDHYQVRKYHAWYRHITLSMLAAAFLVVTARTEHLRREKGEPPPTTNSYHPYPATKSDDSGPR